MELYINTNFKNMVDSTEDINNQNSCVIGFERQSSPPRIAWVLCDDCQKWRYISTELADHIEETKCKWTCKDNFDKDYSDCSIPQAKTDEEINAELEISEASVHDAPQAISFYNGSVNGRQLEVCKQSPWTHIKSNMFLHRNRKRQTIDEVCNLKATCSLTLPSQIQWIVSVAQWIMICHCKPPIDGQLGCGDECLNRVLNIECVQGTCPCGESCSNQQFQRRRYAKLKSIQCGKKGFGLCLLEDIPQGQFLIEYVGEVLDLQKYETRQIEYASRGHRHFYFMTLNGSEVIDACKKGNLGRFVNHSCTPNCCTEKWMVNGEVCVGLFALKDIKKGEELTFDYNYVRVVGAALKKCFCGSPHCRGFIGGDTLNTNFIVRGDSDEAMSKPMMIYKSEMECEVMKEHVTTPDQVEAKTATSVMCTTLSPIGDISANIHVEKFSSDDDKSRDESSKKSPLLQFSRLNDPSFGELPECISNEHGDCKESDSEVVKYRKGLSKLKYLKKILESPSSSSILVKKGELSNKQQMGIGRTLLRCNKRNKTRDFIVGVGPNGVEKELNQLLDVHGGISEGQESTKGYLKLLVLTVMSGEGSHGTIESTRDVSMILDAMLKTKSLSILNDVIKKNGLQMLHNIMKQYRKDYKMTPVLRKLLKILEYMAEKQILTSDLIHAGPPCSDMESFKESILQLIDHPHKQVREEARNFRARWIIRTTLIPVDQGLLHPLPPFHENHLFENHSSRRRPLQRGGKWETRWDQLKRRAPWEDVCYGDSPPGFSRPRHIPIRFSEFETGIPLSNFHPLIPITFGIPVETAHSFGELLSEASGSWAVAPGILFPPIITFGGHEDHVRSGKGMRGDRSQWSEDGEGRGFGLGEMRPTPPRSRHGGRNIHWQQRHYL